MLQRPEKREGWHPAGSAIWHGREGEEENLLLVCQLFTGLLKGMVSVSPHGEPAYSGCLVAPDSKRERRQPAAGAPENLQCHTQAPEGAKDYARLKNHQASLIEKLHTQAQRSHIPPEKVSEAPRIFSWAHVWGSSPVRSKAIKIWKGGCFSICADPSTKLCNMKKQGNLAQTKNKRNRSSENYPNEIEVYELSDKQFKISIIKMLYRLKKMRHEQN